MWYHVKVTSASLPYLPDIGVTEPMEEIIELDDDALEADALLRARANTDDEYDECDNIDIDSNDIVA